MLGIKFQLSFWQAVLSPSELCNTFMEMQCTLTEVQMQALPLTHLCSSWKKEVKQAVWSCVLLH